MRAVRIGWKGTAIGASWKNYAVLPKTRSGKIMRQLLRDIAEGFVLGDTAALEDECVVGHIKERFGGGQDEKR